MGGEVITGVPVRSLQDLPGAKATLLDLTPKQVMAVAGERITRGYRKGMARYRYGMGAFKMDWALDGPIPWRAPECAQAATVHVGGSFGEIADAEETVWQGGHPEAALCAAGPAHSIRPKPCPGRQAHRVGVLPCAPMVLMWI